MTTEKSKPKEKTPYRGNGYNSEIAERIKEIFQHILQPPDDRLSELANLSVGSVHPLMMLQTYAEHISMVVDQVREMQKWYARQAARNIAMNYNIKSRQWQFKEGWDKEKFEEACNEVAKQLADNDTVDLKNLFINQLRKADYQHSRGKEGKLLGLGVALGDSQIQVSAPNLEDSFRTPRRQ